MPAVAERPAGICAPPGPRSNRPARFGALLFRVEAALLYFNVDNVLRRVLQRVRETPTGLRLVICDVSDTPYVDVAGARMLARLYEELKTLGIGMRIVEAHAKQRDILRAEGLDKLVGPIHRHNTLPDVVEEFVTQPDKAE
jgi:SulP family sulfate permease